MLGKLFGLRSPSRMYEAAGREWIVRLAAGLNDPRPRAPAEMDELMAYSEGVARRSFGALYDDEDGEP
jgi:hypothetical protein